MNDSGSYSEGTGELSPLRPSVKQMLPPPNPIMAKPGGEPQSRRIRSIHQHPVQLNAPSSPVRNWKSQHKRRGLRRNEGRESNNSEVFLANGYSPSSLLYQRYLNANCNLRHRKEFFASLFVGIEGSHALKLPPHQGTLREDDLTFDSDFDSGNLMAVFKVD